MIERHVTFDVITGKETEIEQLFINEYRPAMSEKAGFQNCRLLHDNEQPSLYCMVISFDTNENAAAWRESAQHHELNPKLSRLYKESSLKVFEVIA